MMKNKLDYYQIRLHEIPSQHYIFLVVGLGSILGFQTYVPKMVSMVSSK